MSLSDDFSDALNAPAATTRTGLTVGLSPQQRLELAMRRANSEDPADIPDSGERWSYSSAGVPNPYGRGLAAYEPNNVLFEAYAEAKGEYDRKTAEAQAAAAGATGSEAAGGTPPVDGTGKVAGMVRAALGLAQRRVAYVWGGTTANGVDCSGLIVFAARAAGIQLDGKQWPRYRAVDYGRMGVAVTLDQARPGDVVYYDRPGDTDHVGIYIGNGQVVQAPQTGDVVRVTGVGKATSIRRIFDDTAFGTVATPGGGQALSYGGYAYDPVVGSSNPALMGRGGGVGSTITRPPARPHDRRITR